MALRLGSIMRATRRVKRGIGTIREDLNVSIPGGSRVEIKGVQDLRMLPLFVEKEIERQRSLLIIKEILRERGVRPAEVEIHDLTEALSSCGSKVISSAIKKGGKVLGARLVGFAGLMKSHDSKLRLGAEMAQYARTCGVAGIFHSDELPAYGIEKEEVERTRDLLGLSDGGVFVICADDGAKARAAIIAAIGRANEALIGVPEETRDPQPDGSSTYSRPLPGAARMYPETDVPPIFVEKERLDRIDANLPELPEEKVSRFVKEYGMNDQQARQLVREGNDDLLEDMVRTMVSDGNMIRIMTGTFTGTFSELEREGADLSKLEEGAIKNVFSQLSNGRFAKEALPDIFRLVSKGKSAEEAIVELGLQSVSTDEASATVSRIVKEREAFVREKGAGAIGPLMGPVMTELRGKLDGKAASDLLRKEMKSYWQNDAVPSDDICPGPTL